MYGLAADEELAFLPISDTPDQFTQPAGRPGGIAALDLATGNIRWRQAALEPVCRWGREHCLSASISAATGIPGAVFHSSSDGHLRARSTRDGSVLWAFDTAQGFPAVNGVEARGGQLHGWPVVVSGGALYVISGASAQAEPGNALLVFTVSGR
jgi:polyvinyl alcohol dehydrogenase (cytochrome)